MTNTHSQCDSAPTLTHTLYCVRVRVAECAQSSSHICIQACTHKYTHTVNTYLVRRRAPLANSSSTFHMSYEKSECLIPQRSTCFFSELYSQVFLSTFFFEHSLHTTQEKRFNSKFKTLTADNNNIDNDKSTGEKDWTKCHHNATQQPGPFPCATNGSWSCEKLLFMQTSDGTKGDLNYNCNGEKLVDVWCGKLMHIPSMERSLDKT